MKKKVFHSSVTPELKFHGSGPDNKVTFYQMMMYDIKQFLSSDPSVINRFVLYDLMEKLDPELKTALTMISYIVSNSYVGPRIKQPPEEFQKIMEYKPSNPEFIDQVDAILSEMGFSARLPALVRMLIRDGDVYYRIHRDGKAITKLELLPAGAVTIMDSSFKANPEDAGYVIRSEDEFYLNETLTPQTPGASQEIPTPRAPLYGKLPGVSGSNAIASYVGQAMTTLPKEEVLHFAYEKEGHACRDILNRNTFGVYGFSPLETLIFTLKLKMAITLDYMLYSRTGLPRWDFTIDLSEVMNLENYVGDYETRLKDARNNAREIFSEFERQLYYIETDHNSPHYGQNVPLEADHAFIHGSDVNVDQKGGRPAATQYLEVIKKCDMSICSVLGVPISLFGYESGTYAIGYITRAFMLSFGGGLLRSIENDMKSFLIEEFKRRKIKFSPQDFDKLEFEYYVDDSDSISLHAELEKARLNIAVQGYVNGILSKNEARARVGYEEVEGGDEFRDVPPMNNAQIGSETGGLNPEGAGLPTDGGTLSGMQKNQSRSVLYKHSLPLDEQQSEASIKKIYEDSIRKLFEELASEIDKLD